MTIINQKSISGITSITFASAGDDLLTFHSNNGTERFRIDNSGNTKITAGIVTTLTVTGDVDIADKIIHTGDTDTAIRFPAADTVTVETGGSEKLRITSSGSIGIGTMSPAYNLSVESTSGTSINIKAGTSSTARLRFGDSDDDDIGQIMYDNGGNSMRFHTNASEQMRIDSSGNIGINNTSPDGKLAILHTLNSAYATTSRNNTFLQIRNDSTTSGCYAGIEIAAQGAGNDSITQLTTVDTGSGNTDFVIGLRSSSTFTEKARFRNDGGITFNGDTAAANALDDYEEGDWTPTSGENFGAFNNADGSYIKIGHLVTVNFIFNAASTSDTANCKISGLPYAVKNTINGSSVEYTGVCFHDIRMYQIFAQGGTSNIVVETDRPIEGSVTTGSVFLRGSVTYQTT